MKIAFNTRFHFLWFVSVSLIILVALATRFYLLGQVPHGMTWDEAAIGYNGYAILHTRRDEWLQRLPVSFQSFGDYKAPLAIYMNGIFTFLFGMNLWAVRLPFALAGVFSILGMIFLTKEILRGFHFLSDEKVRYISLLSGVVLLFSPWHFHFSRVGFESGISLFFLIWGIYSLLVSLRILVQDTTPTMSQMTLFKIFFVSFTGVTFLIAAMYSYHSAKITVPILGLLVLALKARELRLWLKRSPRKRAPFALLSVGILFYAGVLLRPMILDSLYGEGLARSGTLIFSQNLSSSKVIQTLFHNLWIHLSPAFLVLGETTTLRHGDDTWGVLLPISFLFGLWATFRFFHLFLTRNSLDTQRWQKLIFVSWAWILAGILPAIVGQEVPHSNRAFLALPGFMLLIVLGLYDFFQYSRVFITKWKHGNAIRLSLLGMFLLLHTLIIVAYLSNYFSAFASQSAPAFNDGYLEAFQYVIPYEKGINGKRKVNKILFTSEYGQPYIYALFSRKTDPIWYQGGSLITYEFTEKITVGDFLRKNTLIVAGSNSDLPLAEAEHLVYGSDGSIRFKIYLTDYE